MSDKRRVVIEIDADEGTVLEAPEGIEVVVVPWGQLAHDSHIPSDALDELEKALDGKDFDKAIEIVEALTTEPPDDGYDEDPRAWGGR